MSKVNPVNHTNNDIQLAGGVGAIAAVQDNYNTLRRVVLANLLWEDNAYVDGKTTAQHIKDLIPLNTPENVYNIALEARLCQKLRHTPLFIAVQMCKYDNMKSYVEQLLPKIITRADMLSDFLSIYWKENDTKKIANCAKRGLAEAFHNFNEYQFAKHDRNAAVKLRDVMFLCHPKPRNEYETKLFEKIASRTLTVPDTWEVALSKGEESQVDVWTRLLSERKLGSMALLRNIRNMSKVGVSNDIINEGIMNMNGTMLLPLDYLKSAKLNPSFKETISASMVNAYSNLPKLPGRTLFIVDCSGSMCMRIADKSMFTRLEAAAAMAMLAANQCEDFTLVCTAGNDGARIHSSVILEGDNIHRDFNMCDVIANASRTYKIGGGGIFTRQCLDWCRENTEGEYDRIIIFSDSQDCDYPDKRIPTPFGKNNYIVDVSAHKHGINYNGVWSAEISGWSEHFLTYIAALEGIENTFDE